MKDLEKEDGHGVAAPGEEDRKRNVHAIISILGRQEYLEYRPNHCLSDKNTDHKMWGISI
jgi:hypothetical protein